MVENPAQHRSEMIHFVRAWVAGFALLAFFAGGLPHAHEAHQGATSTEAGPVVSSDETHHDHSSVPALEDIPCALCRSGEERDDLIAEIFRTAAINNTPLGHARLTSGPRKLAPDAHHHHGRAPPFAIAS